MSSFSSEIDGSNSKSEAVADMENANSESITIERASDGHKLPLNTQQIIFVAQLRDDEGFFAEGNPVLIGFHGQNNDDMKCMVTNETISEVVKKAAMSSGNDLETAVCVYSMPIKDEGIMFTKAGLEYFSAEDLNTIVADANTREERALATSEKESLAKERGALLTEVLNHNNLQPFLSDKKDVGVSVLSPEDFSKGLESANSSLSAAMSYTQ